jgi:hypothetical protein
MAKPIHLGNAQVLLSCMQRVQQSAVTAPNPFKDATSLSVFKKTVEDGRRLLPPRYQKPYVDVLEQALLQAESVLQNTNSRATLKRRAIFQQLELVFTTLAAPIAQLKSQTHQTELKAFLALISDIYRHFVDNDKIRGAVKSKLLWPSIDPLGSFSADQQNGPYTFAASAELPIALISKPAGHRDFLPFWLIDGHEVGGHSIFTSVDGFLAEMGDVIETRIRAAYASGTIRPSANDVSFLVGTGSVFGGRTTISMADFMVKLWRCWIQETCADAAGVLNMGPMYVDGMMLSLALQHPNWELKARSVFDGRRGFNDHPTDIVRALLNIELVKKLAFSRAPAYAKALRERFTDIQSEMPTHVSWVNRTGALAVEIKISDLEPVLRVVADALLNSPLKSLAGNSLNQVMPWTSADERSVRLAAASLHRGEVELDDSIQARHVIAAAMLAAERASHFDDFDETYAELHQTGLAMLNEMYSNQCLLCNIQSFKSDAKNPAEVSLKDLVRLVRNIRNMRTS